MQNRVERIKNDRSLVVHKKLLKKDHLNEEKKNIIKINNILNKGISEENLEKIMHQFPQNKELHKVIKTYENNKIKLMDKITIIILIKQIKVLLQKAGQKVIINYISF